MDEFLNLILKRDALLGGVTNFLVVSAVFILIPLGTVSTQRVRPLEYLVYSTAMKTSSRDKTRSV